MGMIVVLMMDVNDYDEDDFGMFIILMIMLTDPESFNCYPF